MIEIKRVLQILKIDLLKNQVVIHIVMYIMINIQKRKPMISINIQTHMTKKVNQSTERKKIMIILKNISIRI